MYPKLIFDFNLSGKCFFCVMFCLTLCLDCIGHVYDALLDMVADESYQLQTEANNACLKTATAMLIELKSPSLDETNVFCRLADRNT